MIQYVRIQIQDLLQTFIAQKWNTLIDKADCCLGNLSFLRHCFQEAKAPLEQTLSSYSFKGRPWIRFLLVFSKKMFLNDPTK